MNLFVIFLKIVRREVRKYESFHCIALKLPSQNLKNTLIFLVNLSEKI